jgi:outer membrane protein
MRIFKSIVAASLSLLVPALAFPQQPITLSDAVRIALEKNPLRKAAIADVRVAASGVREARAGLLPHIMFSEMAIRSNDPVFVFGTKLRQQRFSAADFALNQLNTPTPIGNFSSKFSGQWRLFDSFQNYRSIERARKMNDASREQLERADQELIARVVQSYYGVLLARRHVSVTDDGLKTAKSIEERSRNRVQAGLAVDADLLSAQVLTANREQELIRARNDLSYAEVALAITIGLSTQATLSPADILADRTLPSTDISALERDAIQQRPDLRRLRSEQSAQRQSVSIAKSAFGPRLDAFGSWQTDSHSLGWNGGNNWTAGVELQIDIFSGGGQVGPVAARAREFRSGRRNAYRFRRSGSPRSSSRLL